MDRLFSKLHDQREDPNRDTKANRRGDFSSIHSAITMGSGAKRPIRVHQKTDWTAAAEEALHNDPDLADLCGWQSGIFTHNFPLVYGHLYRTLNALLGRDPSLRLNFPDRSIYTGFSVNYGPRTATLPHLDSGNYPSVPCVITSLGRFNPDRGGHLYFPDLKIYIRFPPKCTVLFSSASIKHGNTAVRGADAERMSITQYVAGGIVRFVRHRFRLVKEMSRQERLRLDGPPGYQWIKQRSRFSTPELLVDHRRQMRSDLDPYLIE
ncbi:uncharacterized protein BXZ73DRAFT_57306 [Epithele typhae]|uniref:uncharacterized protein n=1 Tax=Epithele typhae TaxID=378194 RepID=UPI0020085B7A|nr:uncharacterized protein BXZ73DRAFT_57306 [Epithele typhae]KAH9911175.1 hypothetical protein BXZ73DRAFT_57306 [Epithele typhae]